MRFIEVANLVRDALAYNGFVGPNRLTDYAVCNLIRETWIEHQSFPTLPISAIVIRRVTGEMADTEIAFWKDLGLL